MLRLIHAQTIPGTILVDDIDDGLPNKEVYRLGTTADPKAYPRDGYANKAKQSCYVPFSMASKGFPAIPGYINLQQTEGVVLSAGKGKISKLALPPQYPVGSVTPLLSVISLVAADIVASIVTAATTVAANFQIDGTVLSSVSPDTTTVTFTRGTAGTTPSPAVWTQAAILAAGGSVGALQILIPSAAFTGQVAVANNLVVVQANQLNSPTFTTT
jgi:hypothetical protein